MIGASDFFTRRDRQMWPRPTAARSNSALFEPAGVTSPQPGFAESGLSTLAIEAPCTSGIHPTRCDGGDHYSASVGDLSPTKRLPRSELGHSGIQNLRAEA